MEVDPPPEPADSEAPLPRADDALEDSPPSTPTMPESADEAAPPHQATAGVPGPRPAPGYSVVNAIIEKKEDGAGCRCGHTLTAVAAVGEEGSPGYVGPRLILFGGATALEGNSAAGPPSPAGSAGISEFSEPHNFCCCCAFSCFGWVGI